jgi:glutaredoxin 3
LKPKHVKIYTKASCPYCVRAKEALNELKIAFEEIEVSRDPDTRKKLALENDGYSTVPMIFFDGKFIGGCSELLKLYKLR